MRPDPPAEIYPRGYPPGTDRADHGEPMADPGRSVRMAAEGPRAADERAEPAIAEPASGTDGPAGIALPGLALPNPRWAPLGVEVPPSLPVEPVVQVLRRRAAARGPLGSRPDGQPKP